MNARETNVLRNSLPARAYHTPSSCHIPGKTRMHITGSTSERRNDIAADTAPSLSAVKNDEAYIFSHITRNGSAHIRKASDVRYRRSAS